MKNKSLELGVLLINKMLEKHGVDFEYVKANPEIEGEPWYSHYTMTRAEAVEFEKWAKEQIKKAYGSNAYVINKEWGYFWLMWGLKEVE